MASREVEVVAVVEVVVAVVTSWGQCKSFGRALRRSREMSAPPHGETCAARPRHTSSCFALLVAAAVRHKSAVETLLRASPVPSVERRKKR